jgi:translation initiation factor RLI1
MEEKMVVLHIGQKGSGKMEAMRLLSGQTLPQFGESMRESEELLKKSIEENKKRKNLSDLLWMWYFYG